MFFRLAQGAAYLYPELLALYHTPNENKSGVYEIGVELKRQGRKAGVPDNCLPLPRGGYAGWYGELKRNYGKGPSEEQWNWILWLRAHGFWCNWHRGNQAIYNDLMQYMSLTLPRAGEKRTPQPPLRVEELCYPPEEMVRQGLGIRL